MWSIYRSVRDREAIEGWCLDRLDAWPVEHERRKITAGGHSTHLVLAGSGDRTAVFVPGTNFNAASCSPFATALSERFRLVMADVPGQPGLSGENRPPAAQRASWYRRWLGDVLDHIDGEQVVLIGHSLGAAVVLTWDSPRVSQQVLLSPGGLVRARLGPGILVPAVAWMLRRSPRTSERLLATMHAPGNSPRAELVDWMTLVARHVRTSLDPNAAPPPTRTVDRVIVAGEHDRYYPPRALADRVRDVLGQELTAFPRSGHLLIDERPEAIADLLAG
ncbi:alpha/beta hydrolase [Saccharopolyspora aridisoli]|uniref:Alpha/beta hydrolase n=2 Tax=Saccharopolyspora aridisoli TaxID=2530385 RepID=A0A4R4V0C7_9PSEU|nr:alpha/beta hydrolase [Saccharopolyspora aridisoli]